MATLLGGRGWSFLNFPTWNRSKNILMTRQSFMKMCGLVEGFMAPDEVTGRSPVPCVMHLAIVLTWQLCGILFCLKSIGCSVYMLQFFFCFLLWKGLNYPSATDWNFIWFRPEWGVYVKHFYLACAFKQNIRLHVNLATEWKEIKF